MIHKHIPGFLIMCVVFTALALTAPQAVWACGGGVICVDANATGATTGLSWTDAFTNVQDALAGAVPGDEIWVAEGVYYPDEGIGQTNNSLSATFALQPGVAVYGGFARTESTLGMRNPSRYVTVLSGDIDGNDAADAHGVVTSTTAITGSNAYNVVTSAYVTETARLDGFTITAGNANGNNLDGMGGGMVNDHSSPTLANLIFKGNYAGSGGGMVNDHSSPTLSDVIFDGNRAGGGGGGMANRQSSPTLTDVAFSSNRAVLGGGMFNADSNAVLANVTFSDNQSDYHGGGVYNNDSSPALTNVTFSGNRAGQWDGGGMYNSSSNPVLTNVTFTGNQADGAGGGLHNFHSSPQLTNVIFSGNWAGGIGGGVSNVYADSKPILINVTFSGNRAAEYGGGLVNTGSPTLVNCILWGNHAVTGTEIYSELNEPIVSYSDIQWPGGVYTGAGNITLDPQFVAPITATAAPTTTGDYRLRPGSPAIDAGNSLSVTVAADLDSRPRIAGAAVDMGAYEVPFYPVFLPLVLRN